jgi:hypothetical protein
MDGPWATHIQKNKYHGAGGKSFLFSLQYIMYMVAKTTSSIKGDLTYLLGILMVMGQIVSLIHKHSFEY